MTNDRPIEAGYVLIDDVSSVERQDARRQPIEDHEGAVNPWSYRARCGRATIRLTAVEYRILKLLAARPYQTFTRRRIAEAVSTAGHCVTVEAVEHYVASLRDQLGFYNDYIQSVPHLGYRFKA